MSQNHIQFTAKWLNPEMDHENRRCISRADIRCAWMFEEEPLSVSYLGQLVDNLMKPQSLESDSLNAERLAHISEYLDYLSEMNVEDEVENLIQSVGFESRLIDIVIKAKNLPSQDTGRRSGGAIHRLEDSIESKLTKLKESWTPASTRLFVTAQQVCPIETGDFNSAMTLATEEMTGPPSLNHILSLQRLLGSSKGIRIDGSRVIAMEGKIDSKSNAPVIGISNFQSPFDTGPSTQSGITPTINVEGEPALSMDGRNKQPNSFEHIESEEVRAKVEGIIDRIDDGRGLCHSDEVLELLKSERLNISSSRLQSIIIRLEDVTELEDGWIALPCAPKADSSSLIDRLARKVLSVINGIPIEVMHAQFARDNAWFKGIPTKVIEQRVALNDGIYISNHHVSFAKHDGFRRGHELDTVEHSLWTALVKSNPGGRDLFGEHLDSGSVKNRRELESIARRSVVLAKISGRTVGLKQDATQYDKIVKLSPFVDVLTEAQRVDTVLGDEADVTSQPDGQFRNVSSEGLDGTGEAVGFSHSTNNRIANISLPEHEDEDALETPEGLNPPQEVEGLYRFGSTSTSQQNVRQLLDQVSIEELVLPSIQRGYVWKSTQVRDLFDSLYRGYPVGTMLVWETDQRLAVRKVGDSKWSNSATKNSQMLLLDGQQRMTSLFLAIFTDRIKVYFNAKSPDGTFRTTSATPRYSASWIPVRGLHGETVESILRKCNYDRMQSDFASVRQKVQRLLGVLDRVVSIDTLHDFDYEEVTNVFVRVNSRGTKLKAAELAIAGVAYRLPELITDQLSGFVDSLAARGWTFSVAFFIRLIASDGTGRVSYSGLNIMTDEELAKSWANVKRATNTWLDFLRSKLQLLGDEVLPGMNTHILPIVWLAKHGAEKVPPGLGYWFVLAAVFSRYSGTTETNLDQDLKSIHHNDPNIFIESLLPALRAKRSSLRIEPSDIERAGQQSALVLLMYLAELGNANEPLFSESQPQNEEGGLTENVVRLQMIPSTRLKSLGYGVADGRIKNGGLANLIFVASSFADSDKRTEIWTHLLGLPLETRYQHALPFPTSSESLAKITQFLGTRTRQLLDQFNVVLDELESDAFNPRTVAELKKSGPRTSRPRSEFDAERRKIFEEIRRRIYDLDPKVREKETAVYIGFLLPRRERPFVTVAFRKRVLNFTVDADIRELHDPMGWCRDMSTTGKHGIGNTGFVVDRSEQVDYAMKLLEQVVDNRD